VTDSILSLYLFNTNGVSQLKNMKVRFAVPTDSGQRLGLLQVQISETSALRALSFNVPA